MGMGILERFRLRREVQSKAIAIYRDARGNGLNHEEASDAVVAWAKADYQPIGDASVQPSAIDIDKWTQIIQFILQILALFAK